MKIGFLTPTVAKYIFLCGDVFAFILQCSGGGLLSVSDVNMVKNGKKFRRYHSYILQVLDCFSLDFLSHLPYLFSSFF